MKIPALSEHDPPLHRLLAEKDGRELYSANPHDYYACNYRTRITTIVRKALESPGGRIAEFGCAQGNIALLIAERGRKVVAVDINPAMLTYGKKKFERGTVHWVAASADAPCFRPGSFSCVILGEILEHCADPLSVLGPAHSLLCPDGRVIITTPNGNSALNALPTFAQFAAAKGIPAKEQFGPDGEDHLFAFTLAELVAMVRKAGFAVGAAKTMGSHFLHWKILYHARHAFPWFWNNLIEAIVPEVPVLRRRFTHCLFVTGTKK